MFFVKVVLSLIILFLLYLIHFVCDEFFYKKVLSDTSLFIIEIVSAFVFSMIGGYFTAKIVSRSSYIGVICVSALTVIYMLLNYPQDDEEVLFFWLSLLAMITGILLGGLIALKRTKNNDTVNV